ncbi:MAG: hypothetical protein GWN67_24655 [Phycisphaerae bacterium]|nr:hypothetical protein [Phycisphaerae bacterium]NIP53248.1 hypothetical protein [Phycisphaerae bacterium]NIS52275.1 hypothetical protein [Phycisphaerae bacterium]NIU09820.1 hypothetical protein [Phycisphaerae bacterium]NIU59458.1 hypothetical protein [Phycisphaerae bacterium]
MDIDGVSMQVPRIHPLGKPHPKEIKAPEAVEQPVTEKESAAEETTESSDSQGVLRLLQEGHFKGVADIRLRINFFNELAAIEAEKLQAIAEEQIEGILESVGTIVDGLIEKNEPEILPIFLPPTPPPTNSLPQPAPAPVLKLAPQAPSNDGDINVAQAITVKMMTATIEPAPAAPPPPPAPAAPAPPPPDITVLAEEFTEAVNQLKEDFLSADAPSTDTLVECIQSAFDKLIESLKSAPANGGIEQEPDVEPAGGGDVVIEQTSEPAPIPETPPVIEELTAAFDTALSQLIDTFGEVKTLEPTSEPNGNGVAYQKFLNIYNEMREGIEQA